MRVYVKILISTALVVKFFVLSFCFLRLFFTQFYWYPVQRVSSLSGNL